MRGEGWWLYSVRIAWNWREVEGSLMNLYHHSKSCQGRKDHNLINIQPSNTSPFLSLLSYFVSKQGNIITYSFIVLRFNQNTPLIPSGTSVIHWARALQDSPDHRCILCAKFEKAQSAPKRIGLRSPEARSTLWSAGFLGMKRTSSRNSTPSLRVIIKHKII